MEDVRVSEPLYRFFKNFVKSCILSWLEKGFDVSFFKYNWLKAKIKGFVTGHTVATVKHSVMKMITICSPMIGQICDTMIGASTDNDGYNDPSNCWKLL